MARILYASQVNELKGSIGGLSFHRNAAGTLCRLKPSRVQTATQKQSDAKILFQQAVAAWSNLAWDVQNDWNIFAATQPKVNYWGESKILTGYNWYVSVFINWKLTGGTFPTSPPVWTTPLVVPSFGCSVWSTHFEITWAGLFHFPANYLLIYASPPLMSIGIRNRKLLKLVQVVNPAVISSVSIRDAYFNTFGFSSMPPPGTGRYFIQVSICSIESTYFFNSAFTSESLEIMF